jgi:hypothetical protein
MADAADPAPPLGPEMAGGVSLTSVSLSLTSIVVVLVPSETATVSVWLFGVCSKSLASEAAPAAVSVIAPV